MPTRIGAAAVMDNPSVDSPRVATRGLAQMLLPGLPLIILPQSRAWPVPHCGFARNPCGGSPVRTVWTFHSAGQLVFGRNAVSQLGDLAGRLGAKRVLVVTDPILVKAGLVEPVRRPLEQAGMAVEVF